MRNKLLVALLFSLLAFVSHGQTRHEADSMLHTLNPARQDTAYVHTLLRLAEFHMFKPGELKTDLDSAAGLISQAGQLNATLRSGDDDGYILLEEAYLANEYKDRAKGRQLLQQAIPLLDKGKNHYLQGKAYAALADYFNIDAQTEVPDRMRAFKQAIAAFKAGGYIEQEAYTYKMLAETDSSDVTTEEELNQSLALYNSIHYTHLQGVYDLYTSLYIYRSNFAEALKWGLKALKTAKTVGDSTMQLCAIYNHIAIIYRHNRDSANAIEYYTNALHTAERYDDRATIFLLTCNIADLYLMSGQPLLARDLLQHVQRKYGLPDKNSATTYYDLIEFNLKTYTLLKQFQLAEPYLRQLTGIENEKQFPATNLSDYYVTILDYFFATRQYDRMLPYLKKDEATANAYGNPRNIAMIHLEWFRYDTAMHDYQSAIDRLLQYNKVNNSMNTAARDRMFKELQVRFETEKKEDQIALLNKETQLEKANVKQANLIKNVTLAGVLLTLVIASLLFWQVRLKQKNNRIITHKNDLLEQLVTEKEWLLKEVHHRVKNNLHTVICLLRSQAANLGDDALKAVEDSQHRMYAMSMIHQRLYQSDDIKTIDIALYLREFIQYLSDSFGPPPHIRIQAHIQPLKLDVSQAVPIALIINETVTNAFKYAFPLDTPGTITIGLQQTGTLVQLTVTDDGIGLDKDATLTGTGSMGIQLIKGLTRDLNGHVFFETDHGTRITLRFPANSLDTVSLSELSTLSEMIPA